MLATRESGPHTIGSWIGRGMLAVPAGLFAFGIGAFVAGVTGDGALGVTVAFGILAAAVVRAAASGVRVDRRRERVVVRSLVRTQRVAFEDLVRVEAVPSVADGPAIVWFVRRDGRRIGTLALAYLSDDRLDRLGAALGPARARTHFALELDRARFRPAVG